MTKHFLESRSAASAIEYAMVAGLVSIIIVAAVTSVGGQLNALFYGPLLSAFK